MHSPPPFERRAIAIALFRMLSGPRYDVTVVRGALRTLGRPERGPAFDALRLLHCARFDGLRNGFPGDLATATLRRVYDTSTDDGPTLFERLVAEAGIVPPNAAPAVCSLPALS